MQIYDNNSNQSTDQAINTPALQVSCQVFPRGLKLREINDRWRKFHAETNAAQPLKERTRIINGTVKIDHYRKKALSAGVLQTGLELIKLYVSAYEKSFRLGFEPEGSELPTLFTNGTLLGKRSGVSGRAIRTHLAKMKEYGFIEKTFHGRTHDFEVWITPKFLFTEAEIAEIQIQNSQTETALSPLPWNNLPDNVACFTCNKEKEISNVDMKGVAMQQGALPAGEGQATRLETQKTGNTGAQRSGIPLKKGLNGSLDTEKQATGAGGAGAARSAARSAAQTAVFKSYVEIFWAYASKLLYPGYDFEPEQDKMAMNAIWSGVYGGFKADFSDQEWEQYQAESMQRLDLAATYYRNHQDKYPPMPYSEWVVGTGYFDAENKRGFRSTIDWLIKTEVWRHQQRVNDTLRRCRMHFKLYKQGKAPKRLQAKSMLELYQFYETKFRQLGREALVKFYQQHIPAKNNSN